MFKNLFFLVLFSFCFTLILAACGGEINPGSGDTAAMRRGSQVPSLADLGEQGQDWDNDDWDDASQSIVGPVQDYLGELFVRGSALSVIDPWNEGMYLYCTDGQELSEQYWEYTTPMEPTNTWYIAALEPWMPRGVWTCTFAGGQLEPMLELETWHDLVFTPEQFCFGVVDNESDGAPVLEVVENSGECGRLAGDLLRLLDEN